MKVPPIFIRPRPGKNHSTVEGPLLRLCQRDTLDSLIIFHASSLGFRIHFRCWEENVYAKMYPSGERVPKGTITVCWAGDITRNNCTSNLSWNDYWFHGRSYGPVDNRHAPCYAVLQGQPIERNEEEDE